MEKDGLTFEREKDGYVLTGTADGSVKDLVIPSDMDGVPVVGIGRDALKPDRCTGGPYVRSVFLPGSLKFIREGAFAGAKWLKRVTIEDVGAWCGVDLEDGTSSPFYPGFTTLFVKGGKIDILEIPDGVKKIGKNAFYRCESIKGVRIPASLEEIGEDAFYGCAGLEVRTEGLAAWCGVDFANGHSNPLGLGKTKLVLGGETAKDIVIPDGVAEIKARAFETYGALGSVKIPSSLKKVGKDAFAHCANLKNVYTEDVGAWCGVDYENARANPLYPAGRLFCGGKEVKSLEIPEGTKYVGAHAFAGSRRIFSVTLPQSLEKIGDGAFDGCVKLLSVRNLSALEIEAGSAEHGSVGRYAKEVTHGKEHTGVFREGDFTFFEGSGGRLFLLDCEPCDGELALPSLGERRYEICPSAFFAREDIESVRIPSCVTSVGDGAFSGCANLKKVEIEEGVASLGNEAFSECRALSDVSLPKSLTEVGERAFAYCRELKDITLPEGLEKVADGLFLRCGALEDVTLPKSLKSVGAEVFRGCRALKALEIPEGTTEVGRGAFAGCGELLTALLPGTVKRIGASAFSGCMRLEDVTLPEGLERIEEGTFELCMKLPRLSIPAGVPYIGDRAFRACARLESLSLPDSLTHIGDEAFAGCDSVKEVKIPEGIKHLGNAVFSTCDSLKDVTIPEGVEEIPEEAFRCCENLSSVVLPVSLKRIERDAFVRCTRLGPLSVFYKGGKEDWEKIEIDETTKDGLQYARHPYGNECLKNCAIWYYSEKEPEGSGNFWHFNAGGKPEIRQKH